MSDSSCKPAKNPLSQPKSFQREIIDWFQDAGKDYPWRRTTDPYAILVSEMMLQQTQIATVLGKRYYENWLAQFPDVHSLAVAGESTLLRAWEGLGYYNRARNLQKTAQAIVAQGGTFPTSASELIKLPGIGRYTAGAVATFAFDAAEPIIDANIARVLARLFNFRKPIDSDPGQTQLWEWAEQLVPAKQARIYNSGIMELGQRICTPKAPQCAQCPVQAHCAGKHDSPEMLPIKKAKTPTVHLVEHVALTIKNGNLLLKCESGKRRQGLWRLPEREESHFSDSLAPLIYSAAYTITHHRVQLRIYELPSLLPQADETFHPLENISSLPMPSPYRKALENMVSLANYLEP